MRYQTVTKTARDVVTRFSGNPLISIDDMPAQCSDVWNAGVARFGDEYLLLVTVETLAGRGSVYLARGTDGLRPSGRPFCQILGHVFSPSSESLRRRRKGLNNIYIAMA